MWHLVWWLSGRHGYQHVWITGDPAKHTPEELIGWSPWYGSCWQSWWLFQGCLPKLWLALDEWSLASHSKVLWVVLDWSKCFNWGNLAVLSSIFLLCYLLPLDIWSNQQWPQVWKWSSNQISWESWPQSFLLSVGSVWSLKWSDLVWTP